MNHFSLLGVTRMQLKKAVKQYIVPYKSEVRDKPVISDKTIKLSEQKRKKMGLLSGNSSPTSITQNLYNPQREK